MRDLRADLDRIGFARAIGIVVLCGAAAFWGLSGLSAVLASGPAPAPQRSAVAPAATATPAARAPRERPAVRRELRRALGRTIVSIVGAPVAPKPLLAAIRARRVGAVVLDEPSVQSGPQVHALVRSLRQAGGRRLLIMARQEGGTYARFKSIPPKKPVSELVKEPDPIMVARDAGRLAAEGLKGYDVDVNVAPVVDVPGAGSFLRTQKRTWGTTSGEVAATACAFAEASDHAGVIPVLKHFPGLGAATADPENKPTRSTADLEPFRACIPAAQSAIVMMSSATYPEIDDRSPATLSRDVVRMLREDLGFDGVILSGNLEAPGFKAAAPVRALNAGADLLYFANSQEAPRRAYRRLLKALRTGDLKPGRVRDAAQRIADLR